jgi:hypothetical protein
MTAATVLQLLCKPYQNRMEERLEILSLGGTTIVMMIGQLIFQAQGASGLGSKGLAACQGCAITILLFTACCFCAYFVGELLDARRAKKAGGWAVASASTQQARLPETSDTAGRVSVVHNPMQGDTLKSAAAGRGSNRPAAKREQGQNAATVHTGPSDSSHSHQDNPTAML